MCISLLFKGRRALIMFIAFLSLFCIKKGLFVTRKLLILRRKNETDLCNVPTGQESM